MLDHLAWVCFDSSLLGSNNFYDVAGFQRTSKLSDSPLSKELHALWLTTKDSTNTDICMIILYNCKSTNNLPFCGNILIKVTIFFWNFLAVGSDLQWKFVSLKYWKIFHDLENVTLSEISIEIVKHLTIDLIYDLTSQRNGLTSPRRTLCRRKTRQCRSQYFRPKSF